MTENTTASDAPEQAQAEEPVEAVAVDVTALVEANKRLITEVDRLGGLLREAAAYNKAAHEARAEARTKAAAAIRDANKRAEARFKKRAEKSRQHQEERMAAARSETAAAIQMAEESAAELESLRALVERERPLLCIVEMHSKLSEPVKGCVCMGCRLVASRREFQEQIKALKKERRDEAKARGPQSKKKKREKR